MAAHWSDAYVGRAYVDGEFDCGELARMVQFEVFRRDISLPTERLYRGLAGTAKVRAMREQMAGCVDDYGVPTAAPVEGDAVIIRSRGRIDHVGIYCVIGGEPWVLHAAAGADQVIRTRVRQLELYGYFLEGYYQWKR